MRHKETPTNLKVAERAGEIELLSQFSRKLRETLGLDGSPVATAVIPQPPAGLEKLEHRATVCMMLQIARRGRAFFSSGSGILCGGRANLGMGKPLVPNLEKFLVRCEKLFKSEVAARKLVDSARRYAPEKGGNLVFSPLEKASFIPEVVLFIGLPAQISRIIFLDAFENGDIGALHGEPLCSGAIAAPMSTGNIGISFLDMACRTFGRYKPEEMLIGVPYIRLLRIMRSIDLSSAGAARPDILMRMTGSFLRKRVPANSI